MAETDAVALWGQGNYMKYSSGVCGTDIDQTVYFYCYAQKQVTTTVTTTPVTITVTHTTVTKTITPVAGTPVCSLLS